MNEQALREKMEEYVSTLDNTKDNEWYCTRHDLAHDMFAGFWGWLYAVRYEVVDDNVVMQHYKNAQVDSVRMAVFRTNTDAVAFAHTMNGGRS